MELKTKALGRLGGEVGQASVFGTWDQAPSLAPCSGGNPVSLLPTCTLAISVSNK